MSGIRDRIIGFERIPAGLIDPNPNQSKTHGRRQVSKFQKIMAEIGFAGAILVRKKGKRYEAIDGHMRVGMLPDETLPCLITDLKPSESKLLVLIYDEIGHLAELDPDKLGAAMAALSPRHRAVAEVAHDLREQDKGDKIKELLAKRRERDKAALDLEELDEEDIDYERQTIWLYCDMTELEGAKKKAKRILATIGTGVGSALDPEKLVKAVEALGSTEV
jgi:hypothetical protein